MPITVFDPDERRRANRQQMLQALQLAGELVQIPSAIKLAQAKADLAKREADTAKNPMGVLQGLLGGGIQGQAPSPGTLPTSQQPLNQRLRGGLSPLSQTPSPTPPLPGQIPNTPFALGGFSIDPASGKLNLDFQRVEEIQKRMLDAKGKTLSETQNSAVNNTMKTILSLKNQISFLKGEGVSPTGPLFAGGSMQFQGGPPEWLGLSNMAMQMGGTPKDIALAASNRKMQAAFISAETGANRGFREMEFLKPALPDIGSDTKENFITKGESSIKDLAVNLERMLVRLEKSGFNTAELREEVENSINAVVVEDAEGNRAFAFPDGTFREI